MPPTSPLDIFKLLPQTNCSACREATCLAFAAAVVKKQKDLKLCPHLDSETIAKLEGHVTTQTTAEEAQQSRLDELRQQMAGVDLLARAEALGGSFTGGELTIRCLGRDFSVDGQGRILSHCHTHAWFSIPFLTYVLHGQGMEPTGEWTSFRKLKDAINWDPFFQEQCPQRLRRLADRHSELFGDLIGLFAAAQSGSYMQSDISVVLHPFPKVPMKVCYWKPEDDLDSDLRVFFDSTVGENLGTPAVFGLGTAIVRMLEKFMERHE